MDIFFRELSPISRQVLNSVRMVELEGSDFGTWRCKV